MVIMITHGNKGSSRDEPKMGGGKPINTKNTKNPVVKNWLLFDLIYVQ